MDWILEVGMGKRALGNWVAGGKLLQDRFAQSDYLLMWGRCFFFIIFFTERIKQMLKF